jgi:hypothetical protein
MSGARRMRISAQAIYAATLIVAIAFSISAYAQSAKKPSSSGGAMEKLIGTWHLVHIDAPGPDGRSMPILQPKGMLIYMRDGHMSVQLMYPESAKTLSNEYVLNGYEASFGSFDVDEAARTVTHHVQGSNTRDLLVGKDLSRKFEFTADGHLIIRSVRPDEHWSVTWERY